MNSLVEEPSELSGNIGVDPGQTVSGLRAGQLLFQRYVLRKVLGRGGMGVVWLARDEKLEREVALKFLPEVLFLDAAARDDLKRETRRSLELTHPHIVRVYDFVEDEHAAAISLEYVDGPTLSKLRIEHPRRAFEPDEILPWVGDLCSALDYAHGTARMVHRDLKPANLMLNSRGRLKVTDFGIACSLIVSVHRVSQWSGSSGTLVYMSPQQMRGEMPSHLDDIYALGATLYEMITGKPPFYSGNIALQVEEVMPEPMAARRLKLGTEGGPIPSAWEETIAACLAKRTGERPATAGEVLRRLEGGREAVFIDTAALTQKVWNEPAATAKPAAELPRPKPVPGPVLPLNLPSREILLRGGAVGAVILAVLIGCLAWPRKEVRPSAPAATAAPAAAVPVAAATGRGGLIIKTSPSGATVELGGEALETSPAAFKAVNAGTYPLKISLAGYDPVEMRAEIKPDEFSDLGTISLRRSVGTVQVTSLPEGGDYQLNALDGGADAGPRTGKTPDILKDVPTGRYEVVFRKEGWPDQVRKMEVTRGGLVPVEADFPMGHLSVQTDPPGANVYAGERLLGATPLEAELPPNPHQPLQVIMDGFIPATLDASVEAGATRSLPLVQLQKLVTALQVTSTPPGLEYALSGSNGLMRSGTTPAALFDLPAGTYSVTWKRPGWTDYTEPATLEEKKPVTLDHAFPSGSVAVTSVPPGAEIFLGTRSLGVAPITVDLPPGTSKLIARLQGKPARTHTVTVEEGDETALTVNMDSDSSASSHHHHRHTPKPQPSGLAKLGDSIKSFFSHAASSPSRRK